MQFIADLHIHSHYSMATSKQCDPDNLCVWAARKGLNVVGTGDFTHPGWRAELREGLVDAGNGLYRLSKQRRARLIGDAWGLDLESVYFILSAEISSIYKRGGKTRKIHNLVMVPSFNAAERICARLSSIGNLAADGRPILGLDSRDLLELCLEECEDVMFVPAHIWTPHFSLFGSKSGFDAVEECFDDLVGHITAMETGLSSDPPMNWRLSALDRFALVSNSDAHSPANLARESNLFDCELSYHAIRNALRGNSSGFIGTLEFFPEEGKYHYDGHRKCGVRWSPSETKAHGGICPVCGRPVTQGVLHRVDILADRPEGVHPEAARHFERLVPLRSVIAAALGTSEQSAAVERVYQSLIRSVGPELVILRTAPLDVIKAEAGALVAEGVRRVREGQVIVVPGFDGEYGKVEIFTDAERNELSGQTRLFEVPRIEPEKRQSHSSAGSDEPSGSREQAACLDAGRFVSLFDLRCDRSSSPVTAASMNPQQLAAASLMRGTIVVVAGPGTGKTRTLVNRISELVNNGVDPRSITAVTFTRKAAAEISDRIKNLLGDKLGTSVVRTGTFHSICMQILRAVYGSSGPTVIDESERAFAVEEALASMKTDVPAVSLSDIAEEISRLKSRCIRPGDEAVPQWLAGVYSEYECILDRWNCLDYDDIILETIDWWRNNPQLAEAFGPWFRHLLVDEFQDVNRAQFELVRLWASESESLFVIGDPDQSIYGFRGSDPKFFGMMDSAVPEARRISLIEGYRSQRIIAKAANSVISHNSGPHSTITAVREPVAPIQLAEFPSELSEAIGIVKEIERLVGGTDMLQAGELPAGPDDTNSTYGFSDIAVLYRTGRQADVLEECLAKAGVPYRIAGQTASSMGEEVDRVLTFMKLAADPAGVLKWLRCLRIPKYRLSSDAQSAVAREAEQFGKGRVDLSACCDHLLTLQLPKKEDRDRLLALCTDLTAVASGTDEMTPRELVQRCIEQLQEPMTLGLARLIAYADQFDSVLEFNRHLLLGKEGDWIRIGCGDPESEHVSLMTIHAAKGLEFAVVFVAGCEEGLLPLSRRDSGIASVEEERRLFYVAMTRARDLLYLTYAKRRQQDSGDQARKRSRFIDEIPADCIKKVTLGLRQKPAGGLRQASLF